MSKQALFELLVEELPSRYLLPLRAQFQERLSQALSEAACSPKTLAVEVTPRRLVALAKGLPATQATQHVSKLGPWREKALDAEGQPTPAGAGFAKACGVAFDDLAWIEEQGKQRLHYQADIPGKAAETIWPACLKKAISQISGMKFMAWGEGEFAFLRPVHGLVCMVDTQVVPLALFGQTSAAVTRGHRFQSTDAIAITHVQDYVAALEKQDVLLNFEARKQSILEQIQTLDLPQGVAVSMPEALLDEVVGLVEKPYVYLGQFEEKFLSLPAGLIRSVIQGHQKCFTVRQGDALVNQFVLVSNIASHDKQRLVRGNERVMRARLEDAWFFYTQDIEQRSFDAWTEQLDGILFQKDLGSMGDRARRVAQLAKIIAPHVGCDAGQVEQAALWAKADLCAQTVGEFPELESMIGHACALAWGMDAELAQALEQQAWPKSAQDHLPETALAQTLALADRLERLVGLFGVGQQPSSDKDPFALRRAALGIIRILVEGQRSLSLESLLQQALSVFDGLPEQEGCIAQVHQFILERLKAWGVDQGMPVTWLRAVFAQQQDDCWDVWQRLQALQAFMQLPEAEHLVAANKRVAQILAKQSGAAATTSVDRALFEAEAEQTLFDQLQALEQTIRPWVQEAAYEKILVACAALQAPVDALFDQVMVLCDDAAVRQNRLALLAQLRTLMTLVVDMRAIQ